MGSAWERWMAVPVEVRDEVAQLAEAGRRHPNDSVAAAAEDWAEVIVGAEKVQLSRWARLFVGLLSLLDLFSAADSANRNKIADQAEQRWARAVLAVRPDHRRGER